MQQSAAGAAAGRLGAVVVVVGAIVGIAAAVSVGRCAAV